jgi:3-phosphoshikimate 1-carboxyvinyltransferase
LLAAPLAAGPITIGVDGELVSQPYIRLTLAVMKAFGISVAQTGNSYYVAQGQGYVPCDFAVEPDASAASYFWAAAAVTGGSVTVNGLSRQALQGDVRFCDCLQAMGCSVSGDENSITVTAGELHGGDFDMNAISDTVQTLATVALFAVGPTRIRGVAHIRHKETDRIGDLARELRRLGADVEETDDGMVINPRALHGAELETYGDHRMAMSLALAGLRVPGISIKDPDCTRKTYPRFFDDLSTLYVK